LINTNIGYGGRIMGWKKYSGFEDPEDENYTTFDNSKSGKFIEKSEIPVILVGAAIFVIVILLVAYIPQKNRISMEDYKSIAARLSNLEQRLESIENMGLKPGNRKGGSTEGPVEYQQLINWIKSNAEVINETIKKIDTIETEIASIKQPGSSEIVSKKSTKKKKATVSAKKAKKQIILPESKSQPVKKAETKVSSPKSSPIEVKSVKVSQPDNNEKKKPPEPTEALKQVLTQNDLEKSETKIVEKDPRPVQPKPIQQEVPLKKEPEKENITTTEVQPQDNQQNEIVKAAPKELTPSSPEIKTPVTEQGGTVKIIFHRVEKGETLYRISINYGLSVEALQELNDMKKDDLLIHTGQELIVRKEKQ